MPIPEFVYICTGEPATAPHSLVKSRVELLSINTNSSKLLKSKQARVIYPKKTNPSIDVEFNGLLK